MPKIIIHADADPARTIALGDFRLGHFYIELQGTGLDQGSFASFQKNINNGIYVGFNPGNDDSVGSLTDEFTYRKIDTLGIPQAMISKEIVLSDEQFTSLKNAIESEISNALKIYDPFINNCIDFVQDMYLASGQVGNFVENNFSTEELDSLGGAGFYAKYFQGGDRIRIKAVRLNALEAIADLERLENQYLNTRLLTNLSGELFSLVFDEVDTLTVADPKKSSGAISLPIKVGTDEADTIIADGKVIFSKAGNDIITSNGAFNIIDAGDGDDIFYLSNGNHYAKGNLGADQYYVDTKYLSNSLVIDDEDKRGFLYLDNVLVSGMANRITDAQQNVHPGLWNKQLANNGVLNFKRVSSNNLFDIHGADLFISVSGVKGNITISNFNFSSTATTGRRLLQTSNISALDGQQFGIYLGDYAAVELLSDAGDTSATVARYRPFSMVTLRNGNFAILRFQGQQLVSQIFDKSLAALTNMTTVATISELYNLVGSYYQTYPTRSYYLRHHHVTTAGNGFLAEIGISVSLFNSNMNFFSSASFFGVLCDEKGNRIRSLIPFFVNTNHNPQDSADAVLALKNGNLLFAGADGSIGKFALYSSQGDLLSSVSSISIRNSASIGLFEFSNNNILLTANIQGSGDDFILRAAIYSPQLTLIQSNILTSQWGLYPISTLPIVIPQNNRILMIWGDGTGAARKQMKGVFMDFSGNIQATSLIFYDSNSSGADILPIDAAGISFKDGRFVLIKQVSYGKLVAQLYDAEGSPISTVVPLTDFSDFSKYSGKPVAIKTNDDLGLITWCSSEAGSNKDKLLARILSQEDLLMPAASLATNQLGTSNADAMMGSDQDDIAQTFEGNDRIDLKGGNNIIYAGADADEIIFRNRVYNASAMAMLIPEMDIFADYEPDLDLISFPDLQSIAELNITSDKNNGTLLSYDRNQRKVLIPNVSPATVKNASFSFRSPAVPVNPDLPNDISAATARAKPSAFFTLPFDVVKGAASLVGGIVNMFGSWWKEENNVKGNEKNTSQQILDGSMNGVATQAALSLVLIKLGKELHRQFSGVAAQEAQEEKHRVQEEKQSDIMHYGKNVYANIYFNLTEKELDTQRDIDQALRDLNKVDLLRLAELHELSALTQRQRMQELPDDLREAVLDYAESAHAIAMKHPHCALQLNHRTTNFENSSKKLYSIQDFLVCSNQHAINNNSMELPKQFSVSMT